MKKFLVNCWPVALLFAVLVASCGKEKSLEEDSSQYFLKCKIGGVDKTFNVSAAGIKQDVGSGIMSYSVFGKAVKDASNMESFGFTIYISIPLTAGTYKETDPTTDYYLAGIYNPNTTDKTAIYASRYDDFNPFQITFSNITTTTLAGTFSGRLFLNTGDPNADSTDVTEGSFKVKLQ